MIQATVTGLNALRRANRRLERSVKQASSRRVRQTTNAVKLAARRDVQRIFAKNRKVANSVRGKHYDNRAAGDAGVIYDKFGRRVRGRYQSNLEPYLTGRTVRPIKGRYMAIWRGRGRRRRPEDFRDLVSVRTRGGLWLVRQTRTRTTFLFQLIRYWRPRKRLKPERYMRRAARQFPGRMRRDIESSLNRG